MHFDCFKNALFVCTYASPLSNSAYKKRFFEKIEVHQRVNSMDKNCFQKAHPTQQKTDSPVYQNTRLKRKEQVERSD
jgi:hypothetical protein